MYLSLSLYIYIYIYIYIHGRRSKKASRRTSGFARSQPGKHFRHRLNGYYIHTIHTCV